MVVADLDDRVQVGVDERAVLALVPDREFDRVPVEGVGFRELPWSIGESAREFGEEPTRLGEQRQEVERAGRAGPVGLDRALSLEGGEEPIDRQAVERFGVVLEELPYQEDRSPSAGVTTRMPGTARSRSAM